MKSHCLGLLLLVALAAPAVAGPFSDLIVFGDSLSDVGNIDAVTPSFFKFPGSAYYQGRFSNGPVWVESLATSLGLPPITRSTTGGKDFAYGGAQTTGTGGLEGIFIRDVDEQVTQFLSPAIDPNALYVVYAGANDFDNGQTNVTVPANRLATDIDRLIAAGAREFLVPNLPRLGLTPKYSGNATTAAQLNTRSVDFNAALAAVLDNLEDANSDLTIHRLDVEHLFDNAVAHPSAFGLTNVTQSAAPGLEPGDSSYNKNLIAANANEYLFFDNLHPTTTVHTILAQQAADLLLKLTGDYNDDGTVNAADYTVWRNNRNAFGAGLVADGNRDGVVDGADFEVWKSHYGEAIGMGTLAGEAIAVPEPCWIIQALIGSTLLGLANGGWRHTTPNNSSPPAARRSAFVA